MYCIAKSVQEIKPKPSPKGEVTPVKAPSTLPPLNTKLSRDVDGSSVTRLALNHLSSNLKINKDSNSVTRRREKDINGMFSTSYDLDTDNLPEPKQAKQIQSQAMAVHNATTKPSLALQVSAQGQGAPFTNTGVLRPIAEEVVLSSPQGE